MATIKLPIHVVKTLNQLTKAGFLAFVVGGAVRDILLGKYPLDYDIATSAKPEEIKNLFPNTLSYGEKHGTITVQTEAGTIEVTTFRKDGSYEKHRRPETVCFVEDLHSDLARRDFTINAMAVDISGNVIDPFDGKGDLSAKIIRTVGGADKRFSEDALRLFRALRFAAKLGFAIETNTHLAIQANAHLAKHLSAERVQAELLGILQSDRPQQIKQVFDYGLLDGFLADESPEITYPLTVLTQFQADKTLLWVAFLYATGLSAKVLENLRLDKKTIRLAEKVSALKQDGIAEEKVKLKQHLFCFGQVAVTIALQLEDVFTDSEKQAMLGEILAKGEPYLASHLAIQSKDIIEIGRSGKEIGDSLTALVWHVIKHPEHNTKEKLLALIEHGTEF